MSIQETARAAFRMVPGVSRAAKLYRERFNRHETQLRYLLSPSRLEAERQRAANAANVIACPELEMTLDGFDEVRASEHLKKLGCLLVRGNQSSRDTVLRYREMLAASGYTALPVPRGGALWQFQIAGAYQFPLHRMVHQHFFGMCERSFGVDQLMSVAGVSSTVRTVGPATPKGLVPFHQDISPVGMKQSFTFWMPVDPDGVGRDAPGLRLIASLQERRNKRMIHSTDNVGSHEAERPGLAEHEFFWTPTINVGDVMIFDAHVCHASFMADGMTKPRTSVDLRLSPVDLQEARRQVSPDVGLILVDRDDMIAPVRLCSEWPGFEYEGPAKSSRLWSVFAKVTRR